MQSARRLALLGALLLVPACGGGGGGGGAPLLPPADNGPLAALPLVDTSTPDHVIDVTSVSPTPLALLQTALNAGGKITFNNGGAPFGLTVTTTLTLPSGVTAVIDGGPASNVTLNGSPGVRMIHKGSTENLTVQRLTFSGASFPSSGAAIFGYGAGGTMTAIDCTFSACKTTSLGPDIGGGAMRMVNQKLVQVSGCTFSDCDGSNGGAINSLGCQLTVINSTFTDCDAFGTGGGGSGSGGIGGAIYIDGVSQSSVDPRLDVSGCTFTTNKANDHGGAIFAYTYPGSGSECVFDTCTFDSNQVVLGTAVGFGGAIYQQECGVAVRRSTFKGNTTIKFGGAMWAHSAVGVFENCTFQGNQAVGGSPAFGGALSITGVFEINAVTFSGNHAGDWGGGIFAGNPSSTTLRNSILDRNTGTNQYNGWNVNSTLRDGGNNMQFPGDKMPTFATLDTHATASVMIQDAAPQAIGNHGGPTPTMPLLGGSPAINAGNAATAPTVDQRGSARVGAPDLGSYEFP